MLAHFRHGCIISSAISRSSWTLAKLPRAYFKATLSRVKETVEIMAYICQSNFHLKVNHFPHHAPVYPTGASMSFALWKQCCFTNTLTQVLYSLYFLIRVLQKWSKFLYFLTSLQNDFAIQLYLKFFLNLFHMTVLASDRRLLFLFWVNGRTFFKSKSLTWFRSWCLSWSVRNPSCNNKSRCYVQI